MRLRAVFILIPLLGSMAMADQISPVGAAEEKAAVLTPEEATVEGRLRWANEQSRRYTYKEANIISRCIFSVVGQSGDRLVIDCNDLGWKAALDRFLGHPRDQQELYERGFTTFHADPYTMGPADYVVDIKGTTVEKLVTSRGLEDPSLPGILALKPNNSANGRADFAAIYAAFVHDLGCEVKVGGDQVESILISCRNAPPPRLQQVYSDADLPGPLSARGFRTLIYSETPDVFIPARISPSQLAKLSPITSKQLLAQYQIKSGEEVAEEVADERAYKEFIEQFVDKLLEYSNVKHQRKYASARWTQTDWSEYNRAIKDESTYISSLRNNPYVRRSAFWTDAKDYATRYIGGGGVWQGVPSGLFGRSVTTGSPEKDAQRRAELLEEIDLVRTQVK